MKKSLVFVWEFIKMVVISLAIIIPVRYFLIQPFYVKGASMEPNFHDHEYLIVNEIGYRFDNPIRGEIIVFRYPKDPQEYFIKRIIGLPGESIEFKDGGIMIYNQEYPSGVKLEETYLDDSIRTESISNEKITLKDNEYYVLGDNRYASMDSRSFGPVNKSLIIGKVFFRGWPVNKVRVFKTPVYNFSDNTGSNNTN